MTEKSSASLLARTRLYRAGTIRRLVRSPAAPKMVITAGGARRSRNCEARCAATDSDCMTVMVSRVSRPSPCRGRGHSGLFRGSDNRPAAALRGIEPHGNELQSRKVRARSTVIGLPVAYPLQPGPLPLVPAPDGAPRELFSPTIVLEYRARSALCARLRLANRLGRPTMHAGASHLKKPP